GLLRSCGLPGRAPERDGIGRVARPAGECHGGHERARSRLRVRSLFGRSRQNGVGPETLPPGRHGRERHLAWLGKNSPRLAPKRAIVATAQGLFAIILMAENEFDMLTERVLSGEASEQETAQLKELLSRDPALREEF